MIANAKLFPWFAITLCATVLAVLTASPIQAERGEGGHHRHHLNKARSSFQASVSAQARPLLRLQDQYQGRLESLYQQAIIEGRHDAELKIKEEIKNFRNGVRVDLTQLPEVLNARKLYLDSLERRREQFRRTIRPVLEDYRDQLKQMEKELTASAKSKKAVAVKSERLRIDEIVASGLGQAAIELGVLHQGYAPERHTQVIVIPGDPFEITDASVIKQGLPAATNRSYIYGEVPKRFEGFHVLRMEVRANLSYVYEIDTHCRLYLLVHRDNLKSGSKPEADGWSRTEHTVTVTGAHFDIFEKEHAVGIYQLSTRGPWTYILMSEGSIVVQKN